MTTSDLYYAPESVPTIEREFDEWFDEQILLRAANYGARLKVPGTLTY